MAHGPHSRLSGAAGVGKSGVKKSCKMLGITLARPPMKIEKDQVSSMEVGSNELSIRQQRSKRTSKRRRREATKAGDVATKAIYCHSESKRRK